METCWEELAHVASTPACAPPAVLRAAVAQARSAAKPTMDAAETRALFELLKALSKAIEARLSPPRALAGDIARSPSF
jgi:hypothetical protein